jgi:hypothetical protein
MPKSIEFTASGSSSILGNFSSGQIARNIPDAMADHLVNDARCAKYIDVKTAPEKPADLQPAAKRTRKARAE